MTIPLKTPYIIVLWLACGPMAAAQPAVPVPDFEPLIRQIEDAVRSGDASRYLALLGRDANRAMATKFAVEALGPGVTHAVVQARFRQPLEDVPTGEGYRLTVEVFAESGDTARLLTWQLDVRQDVESATEPRPWRIVDQVGIDSLDGLYHLTVSGETQYDAANLVVVGEDLTLTMSEGSMFVSEIAAGVTALVLLGRGVMRFTPVPEPERGQVRIFSGSEALEVEFTQAFLRVNPVMFSSRISAATLTERAVNERDLRRAVEIFDEFVDLSFDIDLSEVSDRRWSRVPSGGNFVAEIRTRRHGTLNYSQTTGQPEDVMLYEREGERVIALYPSALVRALQGRYYSDEDRVAYDVLDYRIEASFEPRGVKQESLRARPQLAGCWIEGTARLAVRVNKPTTALMLRLADAFQIRAVSSPELGPLLYYRRGQNSVVVSLPSEARAGDEFTVIVGYAGLLPAQAFEENWIGIRRPLFGIVSLEDPFFGVAEPRYVYSNNSFWYPRALGSDYATATMMLTVPADYGVVASGSPDEGNPPLAVQPGQAAARRYTFVTRQPVRYLACVISRFVPHATPRREVAGAAAAGDAVGDRLSLAVESHPRSRERIAEFYDRAADVLEFYASIVGDIPYPDFTLVLTDNQLPGGHSPAYFAVLNQPMPMRPGYYVSWGTDPVSFSGYPSFFLAHELAHQWWGQAVGVKNYHERWLSEGLAQYFAALYAEHELGAEVFADVIVKMQQWAMRHSDEGPVYLGYRLGHIEDEPRVFRALVYNKGAMVLHMLRRLIGDEAFFGGLRRFYQERRFQNAGTDDLIRAFEAEANRALDGFFERWIHEIDVPRLKMSYRTEARLRGQPGETEAVLRFEQGATTFEVPVTVTLRYRTGEPDVVVVPVTEQITEVRVPLRGQLRSIGVNDDKAALADIDR